MFQALIKVPEEITLETLQNMTITGDRDDIKLIDIMAQANIQRTSDQLWNTRTYYNYKLVNMIGNTTMERLRATMDLFDLDWEILAANDGYKNIEVEGEIQTVVNTILGYDKSEVLKFQNRINVYNEQGTIIDIITPTKVDIGKFTGFPAFTEAI